MTDEQLTAELKKLISQERDVGGDIRFVEADAEKTKSNMITVYEAITGRTLSRADPVRLFILAVAYIVVMQRVLINFTGRMNLLRYAAAEFLDELGYFTGTARLGASAALTTLKITLSAVRGEATVIPRGVRVTAGDDVFFATQDMLVIPTGELTAEVMAECTRPGVIGNGYLAGEISQIVDPQPFVQSMVNTTVSQGGADTEGDGPYRERIHQAPEKFSCAGPDGAYRFWAMSANPSVADARPRLYPEPGDVTLYVLLQNGELPGQEILDEVMAVCSADDIRPLTDRLHVGAPDVVRYNLEGVYYIGKRNAARTAQIQAAASQALAEYILWQKSAIGRDINPDELIRRLTGAGVKRVDLTAPAFCVVNDWEVARDNSVSLSFGGVEDD